MAYICAWLSGLPGPSETSVFLDSSVLCSCPHTPQQAAERDNQNLEDKVRSLKTDIEESKYRQRHLKVELKSFLEVLDGKIDDLHDFRRGLSKLGTDN